MFPPLARRATASAAFTLASLCFASTAIADGRLWDGNGSRVPSGRFDTAVNWVGNVAPTAADGALFRVGAAATYTVSFVGVPDVRPVQYRTEYLRVGSNTVTFENTHDASYVVTNPTTAENARGVIVGELAGETAVLNTSMPIVAAAATLGDGGGATGTLNVSAQSLTVTGGIDAATAGHVVIVGNHGAGRLNISNGAAVRVTGAYGASVIGHHAGSDGRATVSGGASWSHAGDTRFDVGFSGAGSLSITTGGRVTGAFAQIGRDGTVTVDGSGSEWVVGNDLSIFGSGNAALNVTNGGRVVSGNVELGSNFPQPLAAVPARVNVGGAGATWRTGFLRVGGTHAGVMDVTAGGQVVTQGVFVHGGTPTTASRLTVHGAGSTWTNDGSFRFAPNNNAVSVIGALAVTGGGRIDTTGDLEIGAHATLTIDGPGSALAVGGELLVASHAATSVSILNGGSLIVGDHLVAYISTVTLDGGTLDLQRHSLVLRGAPTSPSALRSGTIKNASGIFLDGKLHKTGQGTLTLDGVNTFGEPTAVSAGTLVYKSSHTTGESLDVADGAVARLAQSTATPRNVVLKTGSVNTHASGKLDLADNKLIVANGGVAAIRNLVTSAYNGGAWDGPGITTSAATPATSLGVGLAQDVGLVGGTFGGVPVAFGDVLVMYTLAADANLDSLVDFKDLVRVAQNYNTVGADWTRGDFNYDGKVGFQDLVKLAQNYNAALPAEPIPGAAAGFEDDLVRAFASVPEPSCTTYAALFVWGLARRTRRIRAISPTAPAPRIRCPRPRCRNAGRP
jgi:T5SS/PEP-CTERM-associated repeat protein/autotransporter-associated beta strand protein